MAEDHGDDHGGEAEGGEKKKGKKMILIVILLLLLLGGGGAGAYFMGLFGNKDKAETEESAEKEGEESKDGEKKEEGKEEAKGAKSAEKPKYLELPGFIVNLNTGSTQVSFLKATVVLEVGNEEDQKAVEAVQPRIVDDFNTYMRELRSSDLAGSAGLERLREELLARVNKAVAPAKVNNILFKEMIVQ